MIVEPTEAQLQTAIVSLFRALGYVVCEVGKGRKSITCPKCATKSIPVGWIGNTPGTPDLFVTHPDWGNRWAGIEMKTSTGRLSPEQKRLADANLTLVCRNLPDAVKFLIDVWSTTPASNPEHIARLKKTFTNLSRNLAT